MLKKEEEKVKQEFGVKIKDEEQKKKKIPTIMIDSDGLEESEEEDIPFAIKKEALITNGIKTGLSKPVFSGSTNNNNNNVK